MIYIIKYHIVTYVNKQNQDLPGKIPVNGCHVLGTIGSLGTGCLVYIVFLKDFEIFSRICVHQCTVLSLGVGVCTSR